MFVASRLQRTPHSAEEPRQSAAHLEPPLLLHIVFIRLLLIRAELTRLRPRVTVARNAVWISVTSVSVGTPPTRWVVSAADPCHLSHSHVDALKRRGLSCNSASCVQVRNQRLADESVHLVEADVLAHRAVDPLLVRREPGLSLAEVDVLDQQQLVG